MSFIDYLPSEGHLWRPYFEKFYAQIEEALSYTVCNIHKLSLIAYELNNFKGKMSKTLDEPLTTAHLIKLYEFLRACVAFVGHIYFYSEERWLKHFLDNDISHSYAELSRLWDIWQSCAAAFCITSFEDKATLYYAHSQDLIDIHEVLSIHLDRFTDSNKEYVIQTMNSIEYAVGTPQIVKDADTLRNILQHSDWEVVSDTIARGGYASVHLAVMKDTKLQVAVKELKSVNLKRRSLLSLKRELNALVRVQHPNLLGLVGVTVTPPFCIVTPYLPNGSLYSLLHGSNKTSTPLMRSKIAVDIARAMECLHRMGIIHRDLKTPNVLMDKDYRAVVCDYGLSRDIAPLMTTELGTIQWMAPELIENKPNYDFSADVYSFAIVLWELLTQEKPYNGMRQIQLVIRIIEDNLRPDIPNETSPSLRNLIQRCWSKDPSLRPTMEQVRKELESGTCIFPGTDENDFLKWVAETSVANNESLNKASKAKSVGPFQVDLEQVLESNIVNTDYLPSIIESAFNDDRRPTACSVIDLYAGSEHIDADELARQVVCLWDIIPNYVFNILVRLQNRITDHSGLIRSIMSMTQSDITIDAISLLCTESEIDLILAMVDDSISQKMMSTLLSKFGPTNSMLSPALGSYSSIRDLIQASLDSNKLDVVYMNDPSEAEELLFYLEDQSFKSSEAETGRILKLLWPLIEKSRVGRVSVDILQSAAHFPKLRNEIANLDVFHIIIGALESKNYELAEPAVSVMSYLPIDKTIAERLWMPYVGHPNLGTSEKMLEFLPRLADLNRDTDHSILLERIISSIKTDFSASKSSLKVLFDTPFRDRRCVLSERVCVYTNSLLSRGDYNVSAAIFLFLWDLTQSKGPAAIPFELLASCLEFLYHRNSPFPVIEPLFRMLLIMCQNSQYSVFLVKHGFIFYLHHVPLIYADVPSVPFIIQKFADVFESVSKTA